MEVSEVKHIGVLLPSAEQKQRASKNSTYEIKIVPRAVWQAPSLGGENPKGLGDVRKHDYDQTDRAQ
jgi:hypothetical protein